jgi:hypothetical protein
MVRIPFPCFMNTVHQTPKCECSDTHVRSASDPELTYRNDRKTAIGYTSNRYTNLKKRELFDEDFRAFTQHRVDGLGRASLEGSV